MSRSALSNFYARRSTVAAAGLAFVMLVGWMATAPMHPVAAQSLELERVEFTGSDFVVDVAEDQEGTLWFATQDGLVRYDDGAVRLYQHDSLDATSISHNYIEEVLVDREGVLWVGTYGGGLNRYDRASNTFVHYRSDPDDPGSLSHDHTAALYEDAEGIIWVGTRRGLNRLHRETGTFTVYRHDPDDPTSLSNDWARALHEDAAGHLWVGTHGGLNLFDRESANFIRFVHQPDDAATMAPGRISTILKDRSGRLWVGTGRSEGALNQLDSQTGRVTRFSFDGSATTWPIEPAPDGPWTGGGVTDILEDQDGLLWFANWEGWITRYDPQAGTVVNLSLRERMKDDSAAHPFALFQASDGTIWIGSVDGDLFRTVRP